MVTGDTKMNELLLKIIAQLEDQKFKVGDTVQDLEGNTLGVIEQIGPDEGKVNVERQDGHVSLYNENELKLAKKAQLDDYLYKHLFTWATSNIPEEEFDAFMTFARDELEADPEYWEEKADWKQMERAFYSKSSKKAQLEEIMMPEVKQAPETDILEELKDNPKYVVENKDYWYMLEQYEEGDPIWTRISEHQDLPDEFIDQFNNKIDFDLLLSKNKNYIYDSDKVIEFFDKGYIDAHTVVNDHPDVAEVMLAEEQDDIVDDVDVVVVDDLGEAIEDLSEGVLELEEEIPLEEMPEEEKAYLE